ncbi:protein kinase domain-containing protein [Luteimicrobium sp. DT211]|uniref:serine/threonine-protein kinase n=1 Tax=Luteimicrobium sp. DT211 TaxID=3393412 RepID=UPI003CF95AF0
MSPRRNPSAPPAIPGFEHVSLIGSGGFSDVFLYEQKRPRRRVAVKVLLHEWANAQQRAAFDAEADLMARLSTHPSIVTIYEADIASDGRPYLAMEYCSRPSLGTRYRTERLGLAECLRVVVQIAGAVETAHRAGILHRDIKPANILGTDYGHPVLTDFGISSTLDDVARAEGLSIPWSPPESFGDPPTAGVGTDVWALGATLYSFLAGRSPFEVPGGSNGSADLVQRICGAPLRPTGRSDVPQSLERVLATSMAKNPASRYPSVLDFARALQQVQIELALGVTPIDLLGDNGVVAFDSTDAAADDDDEPGTRLRGVVSIDPAGSPGGRGPAGRADDAVGPVEHLGAPGVPQARAVPPTFVAAPAPVRGPAREPERLAVIDASGPAPRTVAADPAARTRPATPPEPVWAAGSGSLLTSGAPEPVEDTVLRVTTEEEAAEPAAPDAPRKRPRWQVAAAVVALVALAGGGATAYALTRNHAPAKPEASAPAREHPAGTVDEGPANDNLSGLVPSVTKLKGTADKGGKTATFTWAYRGQDGDTFRWRVVEAIRKGEYEPTSQRKAVAPIGSGGDVCIEVIAVRNGTPSLEPTGACLKGE